MVAPILPGVPLLLALLRPAGRRQVHLSQKRQGAISPRQVVGFFYGMEFETKPSGGAAN